MTITREMLAAGLGCSVANGVMNPMETTKVKLQLQCPRNLVYNPPTMTGVIHQVAREDGLLRGLFLPGLEASLLRSMMYGAYRVGLYPTVREKFSFSTAAANQNKRTEPVLMERIASGMVTGGIGAAISCPLDVVRTRMQADSGSLRKCGIQYATGLRKGNPIRYTSAWHAIWTIWKQEGVIGGLYRGSSVTIARATLLNGSQLASYDALKCYIRKEQQQDFRWQQDSFSFLDLFFQEGPLLHVCCSLASGIIAQTVVMPMDTIKSHFMLGNASWSSVFRDMVRHGNPITWLYRGYKPACAAQGFCMVLQMPIIEQLRNLFGLEYI